MPRGSQAAANELIRQERELAKQRRGGCMWPIKITPTGLVRRCGRPANWIMSVCRLGVCEQHKRWSSEKIGDGTWLGDN